MVRFGNVLDQNSHVASGNGDQRHDAKKEQGGEGHAVTPQPAGFKTRSVEAGYFASFSAGLRGRATSSPLQFGQILFNL